MEVPYSLRLSSLQPTIPNRMPQCHTLAQKQFNVKPQTIRPFNGELFAKRTNRANNCGFVQEKHYQSCYVSIVICSVPFHLLDAICFFPPFSVTLLFYFPLHFFSLLSLSVPSTASLLSPFFLYASFVSFSIVVSSSVSNKHPKLCCGHCFCLFVFILALT